LLLISVHFEGIILNTDKVEAEGLQKTLAFNVANSCPDKDDSAQLTRLTVEADILLCNFIINNGLCTASSLGQCACKLVT
jgi:hypothetical protein